MKLTWFERVIFEHVCTLEEQFELMKLERDTNKTAKEKVNEFVKEMVSDAPYIAKEAQIRYLKRQISSLRVDVLLANKMYEWDSDMDMDYETKMIRYYFAEIVQKKNQIEKLQKKLNFILSDNPNNRGITDGMIEQAKQYPLENLIEVNKNKALCLFHDDHNPSLHIYKDNKAHCYVCNKTFDVIDICQKLHGITFVQAVLKLTKLGGE